MATTIDVKEGQPELSTLLEIVESGDEVVLAEGNTPIARLTAIRPELPGSRRIGGLHRNAIRTSDDFDEALPESFWMEPR